MHSNFGVPQQGNLRPVFLNFCVEDYGESFVKLTNWHIIPKNWETLKSNVLNKIEVFKWFEMFRSQNGQTPWLEHPLSVHYLQ